MGKSIEGEKERRGEGVNTNFFLSLISLLVLFSVLTPSSYAHNIQPAYLELVEGEKNRFEVTWKLPKYQGKPLDISPSLPSELEQVSPRNVMDTSLALVERWAVRSPEGGLGGLSLGIEGLETTMTDALLRVRFADGQTHRVVLRPNSPSTVMPSGQGSENSDGILLQFLQTVDSFRIFLLLAAAAGLWAIPASRRRGLVKCAAVLAMGAVIGFTLPRIPVADAFGTKTFLSEKQASRVLHGLLLNTYRSFSYENEELAYDQLAKSVDGDLLSDVYLQNRSSMTIDEAEGAATVIDRLDIRSIESLKRSEGKGFDVVANWDVYGSVRHWGHVHYRANTYRARLSIVPTDDFWKLTHVEILDEERVI